LLFFRYDSVGLIVFCIARNDNPIRIGADADDILCVNAALHTEDTYGGKDHLCKKSDQPIA